MENQFQIKVIKYITIFLLLVLALYSIFPTLDKILKVDHIGLLSTFLGIILLFFIEKISKGFNDRDRYTLIDIQKNLPKFNDNLKDEKALVSHIRNHVMNASCFWLLANTGTGFFNF
jgi:hypothetical protein